MNKKEVAERLRESKDECDEQMFEDGLGLGREWAEQDADAGDLERLAIQDHCIFSNIRDVAEFLHADLECLIGDPEPDEIDVLVYRSAKFAEGFLAGAMVVFAEHDKIFGVTL